MTAVADRTGTPGHPAPRQHRVSLTALWFGLFGAPAAWAIQLITDYALLAHFCYPRDTPLASPTFSGVRLVALLVSAGLLVVGVAALLVALRSWRRTRRETSGTASGEQQQQREAADIGEGRTRFMALAGILVSGIFVYGILMAALPLLSMSACTQ
jgi:hypothetical protein